MKMTTEFYQGDDFKIQAKLDSSGTSNWFTLIFSFADSIYSPKPLELTFFRARPEDARRIVFELISELLKCLEESVE